MRSDRLRPRLLKIEAVNPISTHLAAQATGFNGLGYNGIHGYSSRFGTALVSAFSVNQLAARPGRQVDQRVTECARRPAARTGAAGRNEPYLVGTRLKVRQVMETVRGHDADIDQTASSLGIASATVRAAVAYHAEFTGEVEADAAWAAEVEADERYRWEREQAAIA